MNMIFDGLSVFINNWMLITGICVFIATIFYLIHLLKLDPKDGSPVPVAQAQALQSLKPASRSTYIFLALFIVLLLLIRLAFVSKALFPSYFDSAQHYLLIKSIVAGNLSQLFVSLKTNYYHLGFHFVAAFFASLFQTEITRTMLILGQVILALLPLPFFFIVRYVTGSNWAGMFAVVLSAFGWYMPAHAVDWGKYPALMSLGMILLVTGLCYLFALGKDKLSVGKRVSFIGLIGISILFSFFVHSRSMIVLGIVSLAWGASLGWRMLPSLYKRMIFILLFVVFILSIVYIERSDILSLLFDPYLHKGIWVTALICALSIFAYQYYPNILFACLLMMFLLLVNLFIPVANLVPGYPHLTLMDRPYVEMILFMPLSLLGGLGLAGLERRVGKFYGRYIAIFCMAVVIFHAFARYEFYPSDCCVIVGNDDVAAMAWMEEQLPVDARIGIASTELKVVAADVVEGYVGADAGIWITPLTGRTTLLLPVDFDFEQQSGLDLLCQREIYYLFVGELGQTFDIGKLNSRPTWYRPLLSMPGTGVYEVVGCDT